MKVIHTPENWGIAAAWRMPSLLAFIQYSRHTEGVGIMDLDTWVSLGALLSVGAVLIGYMRASMRDLKDDIDAARKEAKADFGKLDTKIDEARKEAKTDNAAARKETKTAIETLDGK